MIHGRMSKKEIAALNRVRFRHTGLQAPECPICTDQYEDGVMLVHLPCEHYYHEVCIVKWFEDGSRACPMCRKE